MAEAAIGCVAGGVDETWRLSTGVIGAVGPRSRAEDTAMACELQLMRQGWPTGARLGALPAIQKALGLGRPAWREAMAILQARGVIEARRGPGGGLFVAAPDLDDVVGGLLLHLAAGGIGRDCVAQFRAVVRRMAFEAAAGRAAGHGGGDAVLAAASASGNPGIVVAARVAETLAAACGAGPVADADGRIAALLAAGDVERALAAADASPPLIDPIDALDGWLPWRGGSSAMTLAVRMLRETLRSTNGSEAAWRTAERLGQSDATVRQARRILSDFGVVQCRRGRRGMRRGDAGAHAAVIRLLAPGLVASGMSAAHNDAAARFLAGTISALAAHRASAAAPPPGEPPFDDFIRFENLFLDRGGNPLLAILLRALALANLCTGAGPFRARDHARIAALNRRIWRAIGEGDAAGARALAVAKADVLSADAGARRGGSPNVAPNSAAPAGLDRAPRVRAAAPPALH